MKADIKKALQEAVLAAITEMGTERFKKTSFFLSNERAVVEQKLAA